jgi:LytTr DNA-binding domain-containing protein
LNWSHFDKYERVYQISFWLFIGLLQATLNSATTIADYQRLEIETASWKPITWELSSQLVGISLIWLIVWFDKWLAQTTNKIHIRFLGHLAFSVLFSVSHVIGMVLVRKAVYLMAGTHYDFGDWSKELIYEYTKDGYTYVWIIAVIYSYRFIVSRVRGEAKAIATGEDQQVPEKPERLLVKKIGKEFIIRIEDIEWVEAAGNYMNLHIDSHVYPLRETMANLESKLDANKFARIHRSTIVNLDHIKEIQLLDSGDYEVILNNQKVLKLSRRYREKLKGVLL